MRWTTREVRDFIPGADWVMAPEIDRTVGGISIHAPTFRPDDMVFVRPAEGGLGIPPARLAAEGIIPTLAIVGPTDRRGITARAVLRVPNPHDALFALARAARSRISGPVVGVTGSAGKTSVTAMIAHCLAGAGPVYATRADANTGRGVAWNLGCVPEDTLHCVLEMAIAEMTWSSRLARVDVAVFTNIHPVHLIYHKDTRTIAQRKALIFAGMPDSGVAVLNADMREFAVVRDAADKRGLRLLTYGMAGDADVHPAGGATGFSGVRLSVMGEPLDLTLPGRGVHAVYNAMAVAGALSALGLPVAALGQRLAGFTAIAGRGRLIELAVGGGTARLLDHSYNANPGSMRAAIDDVLALPGSGRRLAILGEMAELGAASAAEHARLLAELRQAPFDRVYLLGDGFAACRDRVAGDPRFAVIGLDDLEDILPGALVPDDRVVVKGSLSTGLYRFMQRFRQGPDTAGQRPPTPGVINEATRRRTA